MDIDRCPPGGAQGVVTLAALTGRPVVPLDPTYGTEGPRRLAVIDEAWCIGCTLCIQACPTDAIAGAPKAMHTVINERCTGCELCLSVCPVDCIAMVNVGGERTGWAAWSVEQAEQARTWYRTRVERLARTQQAKIAQRAADAQTVLADLPARSTITDDAQLARKRRLIESALAHAKARLLATAVAGREDQAE